MGELRKQWWQLEREEEIAKKVLADIKILAHDQAWRINAYADYLRLYGGWRKMGFQGLESKGLQLPEMRLKLNLVHPIVETFISLMVENFARVKICTEGGNYRAIKKGDRLTQFSDGQFYKHQVYDHAQKVLRDSLVLGDGALLPFIEDDELQLDRVTPDELFVDPEDARYGTPRTLYRHKIADRNTLLELYPDFAEQIKSAGMILEKPSRMDPHVVDPISIGYAWHLPSRKGGADGRYALVVGDALINGDDTSYEDPVFPLVRLGFSELNFGFWSLGATEILLNQQLEVNFLLKKIQGSLNLAGTKIFVPDGSLVNPADITNDDFGIIRYRGPQPPVFQVIQAISPEYYSQVENLYNKAFETFGLSQLQATAKKPAGLQSGRAFREYNDVQSRRFYAFGKRLESFFVTLADRLIRLGNTLHRKLQEEGKGGYKVEATRSDFLEVLHWEDLQFDPDAESYRIQGKAASLLPQNPSGKIETLTEMTRSGLIDQQTAIGLLDNPDVRTAVRRANADWEMVESIIDSIVEEGRLIQPSPYMDLPSAVLKMRRAFVEYSRLELEEEKLELMNKWIQIADGMIAEQTRPPAPVPGAPGMPIPGAAAAPGMPPGMPPGGGPPVMTLGAEMASGPGGPAF